MANIVIVGGGVSGLSCGIFALQKGHNVTVCESHSEAGGNLTGWDRGDYHIDNCIHWLTGTNKNTKTYKIWQEIGALENTEIINPDSLYTCEHNGQEISLTKDLSRLRGQMLKISPVDREETERFIRAVKVVQRLCNIAGDNHDKGYNFFQKMINLPRLYPYFRMSTKDLAKRFSHPLLKKFIIGFLGEDFSSCALIIVTAHITGENGGIPVGGSKQMAKRIADKFVSMGGNLLLGSKVISLNRQRNVIKSVTLSTHKQINADYVVLTTDPASTFGEILDVKMPKALQKLYKNPRMQRFSSYHCAFSLDVEHLPFTGDYIFEIPVEYQMILRTKCLIIREFSHQKDFAPNGKSIIQTLTFCEEKDALAFIELRKNQWAYAQKKNYLSTVVQTLITEKFPQFNGKIQCIDMWTPATYKKFTASDIGSYMSFALPPKTLPIRLNNRVSGIKNLVLATQWLQSPGGLPIALEGGRRAALTIDKLVAKATKKTKTHKIKGSSFSAVQKTKALQ